MTEDSESYEDLIEDSYESEIYKITIPTLLINKTTWNNLQKIIVNNPEGIIVKYKAPIPLSNEAIIEVILLKDD